jgi:pimeloyl-ACP methyl ester carboxylesterase
MPQGKHLETRGHHGDVLPLSLWEQPAQTNHLALVFPGFGYHADLPVLYYPALQLYASGADVLRLEYRYNDQPGFLRQSDAALDRTLGEDAAAVLETGLKNQAYTRFTLLGKSLGTLAMAALLDRKPDLSNAACIWLTPVLDNPNLIRQLQRGNNPGLLAIGTADHYYDPEILNPLKARPNLRYLTFPGADHSLEVTGNAIAAVHFMTELLTAIAALIRP